MKLLNKFIFILCLLVISLSDVFCIRNKNNLKTNGVKCAVSTISIPKGSNLPVVVFRASLNDENINMTVLEKEHINKYTVKGNLVMDDRINGESWYVEKKFEEKNFENMKDAFSLCKNIHEENKEMKLYDYNESSRKNNSLVKFRISNLPENVEEVKDNKENKENKVKTKSNSNEKNKENKDENNENINLLQIKATSKTSSQTENKLKENLKTEDNGFNFGSFIRLKELFNFNNNHF